MWIFIPLFIILFIVVPWLLTKMAADLIGVRSRSTWWLLFIVISAVNWELWQAPKPSPAPQSAAQVRAP